MTSVFLFFIVPLSVTICSSVCQRTLGIGHGLGASRAVVLASPIDLSQSSWASFSYSFIT